MNLPALIKRGGVSAKLEKARAERDKAQAIVAELRSKRDALDVEADDYAVAWQTLDAQISVQDRSIRILDDQIVRLDGKVADEQRAAAKARRQQAIKTVETMLPSRLKIVEEIEAAVKSIPGLFEKLETWRAKFVKQYPAGDVEFPYAHFIDSDRVLRNVQAALRTIRAADVNEVIDGLAREEVKQHASLIEDLKANPPEEPGEEKSLMSEGLPTVADTMRPEPLVVSDTAGYPLMEYHGQPWSREAAAAKLAELDADADFVKAALGGDVAKQQERAAYREMARGRQPGAVPAMPLDAGAVAQQMDEREEQIHEAKLDTFAKHVRMTPELKFQMSRRLATQEQSDFAKAERSRLLKDAGFRAKVFSNDADAIDRWIKITQVAAAPVAPPDYKWNAE